MQQITVDQLATTPDAHVIDVREPDEYRTGHIPGATNIPLSQLGDRLGEIPTEVTVHVICQSGGRSARATEALAAAGVDAINVAGGTSAWTGAGHPVDAA
ncbi:rhodanese-like domain-containing protein [Curtobacterium citreum]